MARSRKLDLSEVLAAHGNVPAANIQTSFADMTLNKKDPDLLFEAIRTRRSFSLNGLDSESIDQKLIERMLEAANWAPTHKKTEPWRFVVYQEKERQVLSDAFGEAYRQIATGDDFSKARFQVLQDKVWQAPVWIALGMARDPALPEWEEIVAFGCAVHNAQLMACSMGLGCKWTSGATSVHQHVAKAVGFAPDIRLFGFLYVGRPTSSWPEGHRGPATAKIRWASSPQKKA
ncbi:MAG: nitroreductase [Acidobacteriota bacterium]|jgi:nitroreductase|nr:nitroreductase [Acidobacteriota bacterium]